MPTNNAFDAIIIGGSYSGLAAGMALGRALRKVLIIDDRKPCNRQTPHSHNFITQDGKPPEEIAAAAKRQVQQYDTVTFLDGRAIHGARTETGFDIRVETGEQLKARKLIFASGVKDIMPDLPGFAACWGISVLHCPYCHGYEVRNAATGILGNGAYGFEFSAMISNWTKSLTLFTNGASTLTPAQVAKLKSHDIQLVETEVDGLQHHNGQLESIVFKDGTTAPIEAIYARPGFEQNTTVPQALGCALSEEGYIIVDKVQKTTVSGIFACGDNTNPMRTVANAVATGTTAGMILNKEMVLESF